MWAQAHAYKLNDISVNLLPVCYWNLSIICITQDWLKYYNVLCCAVVLNTWLWVTMNLLCILKQNKWFFFFISNFI